MEKSPFEVQEQGWGEFEITIKIHFVDSSEKPVEVLHFLKLFNEDKTGQPPRKPIISEEYDEIVFSDPTVFYLFNRVGKLLQNFAKLSHRKIFIKCSSTNARR